MLALFKSRAVAWLVTIILAALAAVGLTGDVQQVTGLAEALIGFLMYVVADAIKVIMQERRRRAGKPVPELVDNSLPKPRHFVRNAL